MSGLEAELVLMLEARGLPAPVREYRFDPQRRWRFDFAWPDRMLAVEIEGGTWSGGRHTRGSGYEADLEKYNAAALSGWTVLRFSGGQVRDGCAIRVIGEALGERGS
jgi:very-short-patch-repair endonuclease